MKIDLNKVPVETGTNYPDALRHLVAGRSRQRIGKTVGLQNFGVNLTTLAPGSQSALRHWHTAQDEFVYVVAGELILITDDGEQTMMPGDMAGFAAGRANGHHLVNRSSEPATYLEIGDRTLPEQAHYSDHDLVCNQPEPGLYQYTRRDGASY